MPVSAVTGTTQAAATKASQRRLRREVVLSTGFGDRINEPSSELLRPAAVSWQRSCTFAFGWRQRLRWLRVAGMPTVSRVPPSWACLHRCPPAMAAALGAWRRPVTLSHMVGWEVGTAQRTAQLPPVEQRACPRRDGDSDHGPDRSVGSSAGQPAAKIGARRTQHRAQAAPCGT